MIDVTNCNLKIISVSKETYPTHDLKEVVLLGRSNVGKSTFINKFCNRKKLAYTSSKPGKTQTLNFYEINDELCFVDVPGYGYAKTSKKDRERFGIMIEEYLTHRDNLHFATLLIDFKVGPTEDDLLMYDFLKYHEIHVLIVCTKKDKISPSKRAKQTKMIKEKLNIDEHDTFAVYSSEDRNDLHSIYATFERLLHEEL
ncbi:ribosome biogenesis GTP-binding protein YihA/YsxC [Mollicutes bacterium LVI A0039]|nr:ribosome biogenesis GTP-binding protein YihA/YsxC [Mollicutes bacterium LVI A0039]